MFLYDEKHSSLTMQVVDAPEILTVIGKIPYLSEFMNSLYDCQYKSFFSAFGKYICLTLNDFDMSLNMNCFILVLVTY